MFNSKDIKKIEEKIDGLDIRLDRIEAKTDELSIKLDKVAERQNSQYTDIMLILKKGGVNIPINVTETNQEEIYGTAKEIVLEADKASTSYLQRKLKIGYSSAAVLMDLLEERGVIGPTDGCKPREVLNNEDK